MANVLILYATQEGQTKTIAEFIADALKDEGHNTVVAPIEESPLLGSFDAIAIGASVHIGHYPQSLRTFVKKHLKRLTKLPTAFFSVCITASKPDEEHQRLAQAYLDGLFSEMSWQPELSISFAGALKFTQYGFFKTQVMKAIAKREHLQVDNKHDYEYTNWERVMRFTLDFSQLIKQSLNPKRKPLDLKVNV